MSEMIRGIVEALAQEPFKKSYNLITFDALKPDQLLQILNDVLTEIDPKQAGDIREEEPDQMALRMFGVLRISKYPHPDNVSEFLQGLLRAEKGIVHPILEWLLSRIPELKKRAYLAKYLVKVNVPMDIIGDQDVQDLYDQYELLIEDFKNVHKEVEHLRNSGYSTAELRKDILQMEEEREIVQQRIQRMKSKVESNPNSESMLAGARALRMERERERELAVQKQDQVASVSHYDQRIQRLQGTLKSLRQAGLGTTAEGLVQKLEEEVRVNSFIVKEKLPRELASKKRHVATLEQVASSPALGHSDLQNVRNKIGQVQTQIQAVREKQLMEDKSTEDQQTLTRQRQQAAIIGRKKDVSAETLNELRAERAQLEDDLKDKKAQLEQFGGEAVVKGEDFKRYVNKLRGKSTMYKVKRTELAGLRAEFGVLSRTEEILKGKEEGAQQALAAVEAKQGIPGFHLTQEKMEEISAEKGSIDASKGATLNEMSAMVLQLNQKIADKKARLAPIIKELRPLRQEVQDMTIEYEEKKHSYDSTSAGLEATVAKLQQQVTKLEKDFTSSESKYHILQAEMTAMDVLKEQTEEETKIYVNKQQPGSQQKSMREHLMGLISDSEKAGSDLRSKQKSLKASHPDAGRQKIMWNNLARLMEAKRQCYEAMRNGSSAVIRRDLQGETMTL